jgi:tRNA(Ile)-lysidine synthase
MYPAPWTRTSTPWSPATIGCRPHTVYTGQAVNWDSFLNQLRAWLESRRLLSPESSWVIGASGGPDSTLLVHAMKALMERDGLKWRLHLAHFHHGLRAEEADEDEEFVRGLGTELGLPFFREREDIRATAARDGGSTEEVARKRRYDFLERVALRTGSELVAVAHHADDNAETVIHRICRGTGLRGLAGIRDVRPVQEDSHIRVVRPFLNHRRTVIEELCAARGLKMRIDSMNRSPEFTRGRIRHSVMPLLAQQLNPNVVEALLRLSEHARLLGTYLEDAAARTFESLVVSQGPRYVVLNTRALLGKQRIIQTEVVRRAIALIAGGEQDLSFVHIDAVLRLAEETGSGKEVHVPGPVVVRKRYERLDFRPLAAEEPPLELGITFVACPGQTSLPILRQTLVAEVCDVDARMVEEVRQKQNRYEEWLDFEAVQPPLIVRGRRDGDRFHPLGAPGAKSVGDFFGEQKLDPELRVRTGILCDQRGPLWVMPLRIDERVKLRPTSRRALRLTLHAYPNSTAEAE